MWKTLKEENDNLTINLTILANGTCTPDYMLGEGDA